MGQNENKVKTYVQKLIEYTDYMIQVKRATMVKFPHGYCCSDSCGLAFSNYQARNYHEWKMHPGCAKYRKNTFWDWLFGIDQDGDKISSIYHSCMCQPYHENKCHECSSKFSGAYR